MAYGMQGPEDMRGLRNAPQVAPIPGQGEQVPVMQRPGKTRVGGGLMGKMMGKMGTKGPFQGPGKSFGAGEGQMPAGTGPQAGGPQQIGSFGVQNTPEGTAPVGSPGLGSKIRNMMVRNRRPIGGGPGRPGGPPDPRLKEPMGGMY